MAVEKSYARLGLFIVVTLVVVSLQQRRSSFNDGGAVP